MVVCFVNGEDPYFVRIFNKSFEEGSNDKAKARFSRRKSGQWTGKSWDIVSKNIFLSTEFARRAAAGFSRPDS
jgi:hypothetical protein